MLVDTQSPEARVTVDRDAATVLVSLPAQRRADTVHNRPDPGSRPWLLAEALRDEDGGRGEGRAGAERAEEKPERAAPMLGTMAEQGEDEFPEDKFHRMDALSMHFLAEREKTRESALKKEAEREEERRRKQQEALERAVAREEASRGAGGAGDEDWGELEAAQDLDLL